jgi:ammonia channel protein AmtB
MIDGVLGSLVAVSAGGPLFRVYEGIFVGAVGAALALTCGHLLDKIHFDDPVRSTSVHGITGLW